MTGSSILPVSLHKGELYFLFGKENDLEDSAKGFSDFGGGVDTKESLLDAAYREGSEELTGFLGDSEELKIRIKKQGGVFPISHKNYHVHIFYIEYDSKLPLYYNNNHKFLWSKMNKNMLNKTKLFEKIEIQWFNANSIKKRIKEFRPFYRDIVKNIISNKTSILRFITNKVNTIAKRQKKRKRRTRKIPKQT